MFCFGPMRRFFFAFREWSLIFSVAICFFGATKVSGQIERQRIAGGGLLAGRILNPEASPESATEIELPGGGKIVLNRLVVAKEVLQTDVANYRMESPMAPDTVASHEQLAAWCRERGMDAESRLHYQRILEMEPENGVAHKALGHVLTGGTWMTPRERLDALGYESVGGNTMTRQEAELERQKNEAKKESQQWQKGLRAIQLGLRRGDAEARAKLRSITAPTALPEVTALLKKEENPQLRVLYVQAMGKIGTPAALRDLVTVAVIDDHPEVRLTALEILLRRPDALPMVSRDFRRYLGHGENVVVNRAGAALGYLGADDALVDLINALVTRHKWTIEEGGDQMNVSFSQNQTSFSPGTGTKIKTVVETFENQDVYAAVRQVVARNYDPPVDFGFDKAAWKQWLMNSQGTWEYSTRRDF